MKRATRRAVANSLSVLVLLVFASGLSWTQDITYSQSGDEGYRGRVLRLSLVEGDVSLQHGANEQWLDVTINAPLVQGDRLWVGAEGRTEIEFDDGSYVRLASNSVLEIQQLDQTDNGRYTQIFLSQGLGYFNIRQSYNDTFRVTTPSLAADVFNGGARYRLSVDDRNDLTVFGGQVQVDTHAGNVAVRTNELFSLANTDTSQYYLGRAPARDDWDRWNFDRDNYLTRATSNQYLPSSVSYGANDLDQYGHWVDQPGYGYVWAPYNVDSEWIPYSYGRWAWYPGMGYTWISYEPWGWLPYHYGGWEWFSGFGWAWCPGRAFGFWSPARAFFFNVGGFVGWCPFSPFDHFFGGSFINLNVFRPRNFFSNRLVVVNNRTFINGVISRQNIVSNREMLNQVTTRNNLQLGFRPQVERTSGSEVIRPGGLTNNPAIRLASDTKGWTRQDGIRGTGAQPSESLRMNQPFGATGTSGSTNRQGVRSGLAGNGGTINNRGTGSRRSEVINPAGTTPGASPAVRTENGYRSPANNGREVIQGPAIRTPYSGGSESKGIPVPSSATVPRYEGSRSQPSTVQTPRNEPYRGNTPSQPRGEEKINKPADKTKTNSSSRYDSGSQWQNYAQGSSRSSYNGPSAYNSNRSSYNSNGTGRIERVGPNSYASSYNPPAASRSEMRSSYTPSSARSSYSAPAPRYESPAYPQSRAQAPRYETPHYSSPSYSVPRSTYSAPSMPRSNYSAPSYSHPTSSYRSAPSSSHSSGGGGGSRGSGSRR